MQVADHEQLMRATLRAARILVEFRGMQPISVPGYDIDLQAWLQRADSIELLDAMAHHDVARAFFVEMLSHAARAALIPDSDTEPVPLDAETTARAYRAATQRAPKRQGFVCGGQICIPERLLSNHSLFLSKLHPIAFVATDDARPHAALNYRLALVVHAGPRLAIAKQTILGGLERLRRLRRAHADLLGSPETVHARLFVIIWRDKFHPRFGEQRTNLQTAVAKLAASVAAERLTLEVHNVIELQYDATRNARVPRHTAVDRATEPGIATIRDAEFRTILIDDVQVRLHDFAVGQIIRIDRNDLELGGDELTYNMVRRKAGTE